MMREEHTCDTCGAETRFCINGVDYCAEHAYDGIGVQARLVTSLGGADSETVKTLGEWAQQSVVEVLGFRGE